MIVVTACILTVLVHNFWGGIALALLFAAACIYEEQPAFYDYTCSEPDGCARCFSMFEPDKDRVREFECGHIFHQQCAGALCHACSQHKTK